MCNRIIAQVRHRMGHEVMNWFGYDASHVVKVLIGRMRGKGALY